MADYLNPEQKQDPLMELLQMDLSKSQTLLEDQMPQIAPTPQGRIRLIRALQNRFGENFKAFPQAQEALQQFDVQHEQIRDVMKLRSQYNGTGRD